jgi:hypothetical protein
MPSFLLFSFSFCFSLFISTLSLVTFSLLFLLFLSFPCSFSPNIGVAVDNTSSCCVVVLFELVAAVDLVAKWFVAGVDVAVTFCVLVV